MPLIYLYKFQMIILRKLVIEKKPKNVYFSANQK